MIINNIDDVKPQRNGVIVKSVINPDEVIQFSTETKIATRKAEVISIGPDVSLPENCSSLKVGDVVIFTQFAGAFLPSNDEALYKLIRGYDIIGIMNNGIDEAVPTANRVLVEELRMEESEDGLINTASSNDPSEANLFFGKIVKIGSDVTNTELKPGMTVAYAPYMGTTIREFESDASRELKIIVEHDVLLIMK